MRIETTFFVPGVPRAKGSMRAFKRAGMRHAVVINSSSKVKPWQQLVATAAKGQFYGPTDAAVEVDVTFFLPRGKGHYGTGRNARLLKTSAPSLPTSHALGDLDKHLRCVFDALTGVAFVDDSLVVDSHCSKRFEDGRGPGAQITVRMSDYHGMLSLRAEAA